MRIARKYIVYCSFSLGFQIFSNLFYREIQPVIKKNKEREHANATYTMMMGEGNNTSSSSRLQDQMDNILDMREYDVPYHCRVSIDRKINVVRYRLCFS